MYHIEKPSSSYLNVAYIFTLYLKKIIRRRTNR